MAFCERRSLPKIEIQNPILISKWNENVSALTHLPSVALLYTAISIYQSMTNKVVGHNLHVAMMYRIYPSAYRKISLSYDNIHYCQIMVGNFIGHRLVDRNSSVFSCIHIPIFSLECQTDLCTRQISQEASMTRWFGGAQGAAFLSTSKKIRYPFFTMGHKAGWW